MCILEGLRKRNGGICALLPRVGDACSVQEAIDPTDNSFAALPVGACGRHRIGPHRKFAILELLREHLVVRLGVQLLLLHHEALVLAAGATDHVPEETKGSHLLADCAPC